MSQREVRLTTIGLSSHDEGLVKAFLGMIRGKTRVKWTHSEDIDVDVAICTPGNALSDLVRAREGRSGRPLCTALLKPGEHSSNWNRVLHQPMRIRGFLDALETLTSELEQPASTASKPVVQHGNMIEARRDSAVAVLRSLHESSDDRPRCIVLRAAGVEVVVHMPQGRCYSPQGFGESVIASLSRPDTIPQVEEQPESSLQEEQLQTQWLWLDALLWTIGSNSKSISLLGQAEHTQAFHLRCWPDFGKIPSHPMHIKLTALLIKQVHTAQSLAGAAAVSVESVGAFLRASACCGILEVIPLSEHPVPAYRPTERVRGMFNSLRAALGMSV